MDTESSGLVRLTFYLTYVLLITTGTITFVEALRTTSPTVQNTKTWRIMYWMFRRNALSASAYGCTLPRLWCCKILYSKNPYNDLL